MSQELAVESALEAAFAGEEPPKPEVEVEEAPAEEVVAEEAAEEAPPEEVEAEPEPAPEPEYEIEVSGQRQTVRGEAHVKELLQKGLDYQQKTEQTARFQEALMARAQVLQLQEQFQTVLADAIAELRVIDSELDVYTKIDWASQFDTDPFQALKLREQRDALREQRNAKLAELNRKHDEFKQGQATAASQLLASEQAALLAKVPEWRNSEKAAQEKTEIARLLMERYGYSPAELNIMDHRLLYAARDLLHYNRLQSQRADKVKQARTAPPVVKPGTVQKQTSGKQDFVKVRSHLRKLGSQGNHKAQEALVTEMFSKTFKI